MKSDEEKYHALQQRLNAIDKVMDPDSLLPSYIRVLSDLSFGAAGEAERRFYLDNGQYIIEWSERGKLVTKAVYVNEDECAYSIVLSKIQYFTSYQGKNLGIMTDEQLKLGDRREFEAFMAIDVKWAKKYREESAEQLAETLQRRAKMRELDRNSAPER